MILWLILSAVTAQVRNSMPIEQPIPAGSSYGVVQYDDGTAQWLSWGGLYRGVWFHLDDFDPDATGYSISGIEFWFGNPSEPVPVMVALYDGLFGGDLLAQESMMSSQATWEFDPPIEAGMDWSVVVDTELSPGGWPAILGDGTPNTQYGSHSFYSDDFVVWEPWIIQGPDANDYLIRTFGEPLLGLDGRTWGDIKVLFGR